MDDLYIPNCCIQKLLPALLRKTEGSLAMFYSQGDWGINKLWNAVSYMVSNTVQTKDGQIEPTGGKIQMMLVVPTLDANILYIVNEYYRRGWFDHMMLVTFSVIVAPEVLIQYKKDLGDAMQLLVGRKEAQRQSFWLKWDDNTYNSLLVSGPMYSRDTNNAFAQYTATFFDQEEVLDKETERHVTVVNKRGKEMVEMVMRPWYHIANVYGKNKR